MVPYHGLAEKYQYIYKLSGGQVFGPTDMWDKHLTHWGRDKMTAIFQTTSSNVLSWMKMYEFRLRFHFCSWGSNQQYSSIGSGNGLAPVRRQAIAWTNNGLVYWRIYASLGLNELKG